MSVDEQHPIRPDEIEPCLTPEKEEIRAQRPTVARDPGQPTNLEVEEHEAAGHVEYRSWCVHCIRGRARDCQHRLSRRAEGERLKPVISWDYCYPGDASGDKMIVLVGQCPETKAIFAHCCKSKGMGDGEIANKLERDLDRLGHPGDVGLALKSDQ